MTGLSKLKAMTDEDIQNWLRKVDVTSLEIALLGADDETKNCVFRNMSERASDALKETMDIFDAMSSKELIIRMNESKLERLM